MAKKQPSKFKAAILGWLGIPIGMTDSGFWSEWSGSSISGVTVTHKSMLQLSAVWACTRLISETIATLPISMYEKTASGKRVAKNHALQMIIHDQPNADTTAAVYWEATVAAMMLRGCAISEKLMIGSRVVGLKFLYPDRLSLSFDGSGGRIYRYTEKDGRQREIPTERLFTIPGFSLDGVNGVSVIAYGANVFGNAIAADTAAANTFSRGMMPTVYYKYPKVLKSDQRSEAREAIKKISGAINAGEPAILEADMEAGTIGINPNDAQLLESRGYGVEEVCRWFRVPPFMVGHAEKSSNWGTGIEQQMIGFLTFTLGPWLRRIEQAISKDLLTPAERLRYYPKFSVEGLLRADSAGRSAFYSSMVNNGILTRDEVRELEDREPMGGNAAVLTVQTALAPLDTIGVQAGAMLRGEQS